MCRVSDGRCGRTRDQVLHGQGDRQSGHQQLVRGRVKDGPDDGLHLVSSRQVPIDLQNRQTSSSGNNRKTSRRRKADQVRQSSVHEQPSREVEVVIYDGQAEDGARDHTRDGQQVGNGVDVLS